VLRKALILSAVFISCSFCWPPSTCSEREHYLSLRVEEEPVETGWSEEGYFPYWSTSLIGVPAACLSSSAADVRSSCLTTACHQECRSIFPRKFLGNRLTCFVICPLFWSPSTHNVLSFYPV